MAYHIRIQDTVLVLVDISEVKVLGGVGLGSRSGRGGCGRWGERG